MPDSGQETALNSVSGRSVPDPGEGDCGPAGTALSLVGGSGQTSSWQVVPSPS